MIKTDLHIHTVLCDGRDTPAAMAQAAYEKGFERIGFSGHSYTSYDEETCMSPEETGQYRIEVDALKKLYRGKMDILCGIEQDYLSDYPPEGFDYVISSVHSLRISGKIMILDQSEKDFIDLVNGHYGGDFYAAAEDYYGAVADGAEKWNADIIGHFDLITKFNEGGRLFDTRAPRYVKAWKSCADRLLKLGIPFEINTGAISRGYRLTPYPAPEIAGYIKERGGRLILASDAHCKENIGFMFGEYEHML